MSNLTPDGRAPEPLADLLDVLDLRRVGEATIHVDSRQVDGDDDAVALSDTGATVFEGRSQPQPWGRIFGGQVLAQAIVAAGRTVDPARPIHSMHGYFLRPGDPAEPLRFAVERMRDGRSFSARRTHALQRGKPILSMIASFQLPGEGPEHAEAMPSVPPPEACPGPDTILAGIDHPVIDSWRDARPVEMRHVGPPLYLEPAKDREPAQQLWVKARGELPDDDPLLHAAVLAYASDYALLEPVLRRQGTAWAEMSLRTASLDHAMWFHRPPRADSWLLYDLHSPFAGGARALGTGRFFDQAGRLVASVGQELMVRPNRSH